MTLKDLGISVALCIQCGQGSLCLRSEDQHYPVCWPCVVLMMLVIMKEFPERFGGFESTGLAELARKVIR